MTDWASLPGDILAYICQHLRYFDDAVAFGVVCKTWHSAFALVAKPSLPPKFPWIIQIERKDEEETKFKSKETRLFYNLSRHLIYEFKLPEASCRKWFGTCFGWLLTVGLDLKINLLHPFTRLQVLLPPNPTFDEMYVPELGYLPEEFQDIVIRKAVLSSNPWEKIISGGKVDIGIMAMFSEASLLAFARIGDKTWTKVQVSTANFEDIVYYKDRFYAVDRDGRVVVCDIDEDQTPRGEVITVAPKTGWYYKKYLVESSGHLLLVNRFRKYVIPPREDVDTPKRDYTSTSSFNIWKLEEHDEDIGQRYSWTRVNSLDNRALFVGNNSSVSVPASECCRANCIYFTDDTQHEESGHDLGIYNAEERTITDTDQPPSFSFQSAPFWYVCG